MLRGGKILALAHPDLVDLIIKASETMDLQVICSYRGEKAQNEAFAKGASNCLFPNSKHNSLPSMAVDVVPFNRNTKAIDWNDIAKFKVMGAHVLKCAKELGINVVWGGGWRKFDGPHFEKGQ